MNDETTKQGYSIGELADAADVSRRTVRYYVQQGLLDAPVGLGRSAHYTDAHLVRLKRIKQLQELGHPVGSIRHLLDGEAPAAEAPSMRPSGASRRDVEHGARPAPTASDDPELDRGDDDVDDLIESWMRIPMIDGVEVHVRVDRLRRVPMEMFAEMAATLRHHLRQSGDD